MAITVPKIAALLSTMVIVGHLFGGIGLDTTLIFLLPVLLVGISFQHFGSSERAISLFQNLLRAMKKLLNGIMTDTLLCVVLFSLLIVVGGLCWLVGKVVGKLQE